MLNIVINEAERAAFFDTLKKFIVGKLGYSLKQASSIDLFSFREDYFTLQFKKGLDDLYLKIGDYSYAAPEQKSIVISRIGFRKSHSGSGTELLKELCKLGQEFKYDWLYIECPNPGCQEFMKKLGFKDTSPISIHELKNSIQEYENHKVVQ